MNATMYIKIIIYMKILKQSTHPVDCVIMQHVYCSTCFPSRMKFWRTYVNLLSFFLRIQGCFHLTLPFTTQNWSLECQCNISPAKCTWTKYTSNSFIFRCYMRHIYFIHIMQQSVKLPTINVSWEFNDFFPCPLIVTLIDLPLELCIWGTT